MSTPISPTPCKGPLGGDLPAFVSNGLVGLRVRDVPMISGMSMLAGFCGEHPIRKIEAAAATPYPLFTEITVNGAVLSAVGGGLEPLEQSYDFSNGELTSRLRLVAADAVLALTVTTFASRPDPAVVCQEIQIEVEKGPAELELSAGLDGGGIEGRAIAQLRDLPGEDQSPLDGCLHWEGAGALSSCGVAYCTELLGAEAERDRPSMQNTRLATSYKLRLDAGQAVTLRQIAALIPSVTHHRPDQQAVRHVCLAAKKGFDALRRANRDEWAELWKGRVVIHGADEQCQRLADAAFFYLMSSTHAGSPASTSMFGLAAWRTYNYYYGQVMWDVETFCLPLITLIQPEAARSLLAFRYRTLESAENNARVHGRAGAQYPWQSGPVNGQESGPLPGRASWYEDHVSADIAIAFIAFCRMTSDEVFKRQKAWPVVSAVADWLCDRAEPTARGFEIFKSMGVAERAEAVDNPAYMNLTARLALEGALEMAGDLGLPPGRAWQEVAEGLVLPLDDGKLVGHDDFDPDGEKAATPDPLTALYPLGMELASDVAAATLAYYLSRAEEYVGSPMLSALYGVWACQADDPDLSLRMLSEGYGAFDAGRFNQILEYRPDRFPDQPRAGPFFANMGGFLGSIVFGFCGLELGLGVPRRRPAGPVLLPRGWESIEIERLWLRGAPHRLVARAGSPAQLIPVAETGAPADHEPQEIGRRA
ncbi:hypothetical protein LJR164_004587 [Phenylobacterium sp. LjRoot164]|uniref:glycoside hydrolase family 65 protein n=1 Tax=unclassified Phenylobacterium TaxID=2640670 RepID=UPI003ECD980B